MINKRLFFASFLAMSALCLGCNDVGETSDEVNGEQNSQKDPSDVTEPSAKPDKPSLVKLSSSRVMKIDESGMSDQFAVSLVQAPTSDVHISLKGSPDTEGKLDIAELVFTQDNWDKPQTVTVTGVSDDVLDGNQIYTIEFAVSSDDEDFNNAEVAPLRAVNGDTHFIVEGYDGLYSLMYLTDTDMLITDELGTRTPIMFQLSRCPAYDVEFSIESLNPSEALPERSVIRIAPEECRDLKEVDIMGVDDDKADGDQPFQLKIVNVRSEDPFYDGASVQDIMSGATDGLISGINQDDEKSSVEHGLVVKQVKSATTKTRGLVTDAIISEDGTSVQYTVNLKSAPKNGNTVFVTALNTDPSEGRVEPSTVTFDESNWDEPQTFTITGVDDDEIDGDIMFAVRFVTYSDDLTNNNLESDNVIFINEDNDGELPPEEELTYAILVQKGHDVLYTNEDGMSKKFSITLNRQPESNVHVYYKSSDPSEGEVYPNDPIRKYNNEPYITITPLDWNIPHVFTVTGQDDDLRDGAVMYDVTFKTHSEDAHFNDISTPVVSFKNFDNDETTDSSEHTDSLTEMFGTLFGSILINVSGADALPNATNYISDEGTTIWVNLNTIMSSDVSLRFRSSDCGKAKFDFRFSDGKVLEDICTQNYTFTSDNYSKAVGITIKPSTALADGEKFKLIIESSESGDDQYTDSLRVTTPFIYQKSEGSATTPSVPVTPDVSDYPRLIVAPDICNSLGVVTSSETQKYAIHLARQPRNNVKVTFSIPEEYSDLVKFKNNKFNLTFRAGDYNVDQYIEIVSKGDAATNEYITLNYTMTSADESFNGESSADCKMKLVYNPVIESTEPVGPKGRKLRIMAANTTSGGHQLYTDPGMNMFYAMDPDIILIQEYAPSAKKQPVTDRLEDYFGTTYTDYVGPGRIGNGIIVKGDLKIKETFHLDAIAVSASGVPVSDRGYEAAIIDLPGEKDLLAISLHLYTKCRSGETETMLPSQRSEYTAIANFIREMQTKGDYYVVVGGDFNSTSSTLVQNSLRPALAVDVPFPVDQNGNSKTNASRARQYDWLLADSSLEAYSVPTTIGSQVFPNGYVLDSRVHTPLSEIAPVCYGDSDDVEMQHMPIVRDFYIEY